MTLKGLRVRLISLLNFINQIAEKEEVDSKTIAAYALQSVSNQNHDQNTSTFCKEIILTCSFGKTGRPISIEKATFLLDQLDIGKQKYIDLRRLLKVDDILFPAYRDVALYRADITLANELQFFCNSDQVTIGVCISYHMLLKQTVSRLLSILPELENDQFPLTMRISDGLDGSGSHQVYNQLQTSTNPSSKNFLLFAFKILSITDKSSIEVWSNAIPNSHFQIRPVALIAMKESEENVKYLMDTNINPETTMIEEDSINLLQGQVRVKVIRSMFDGKMSGISTGATGAKCQLCTDCFIQRTP